MKKQCDDHDNSMDDTKADLIKYKSKNFTRKHPQLGEAAKENIREEFHRLTKFIQGLKQAIHAEMFRILDEKEKQEVKPAVAQAPAAQASGSTTKVEVSYDPMSSYNPMIWKDCKLTMKSNWLEYIDWKRKIDTYFNFDEKLASHDVQLRVI